MLFTVLISIFFIALAFYADVTLSSLVTIMEQEFGANFVNRVHIFINADPKV